MTMFARRDEVVVFGGDRDVLLGAFQTINALKQELGDGFATAVGHSWEDAHRLLVTGNRLLYGRAGSAGADRTGGSRIAVFFLSQPGAEEIVELGMTSAAADLLLRACRGALANVEDWEFSLLIGAEISEIREAVAVLEEVVRNV